jgi:hypothetical protein
MRPSSTSIKAATLVTGFVMEAMRNSVSRVMGEGVAVTQRVDPGYFAISPAQGDAAGNIIGLDELLQLHRSTSALKARGAESRVGHSISLFVCILSAHHLSTPGIGHQGKIYLRL